jgi:hypothetical protein
VNGYFLIEFFFTVGRSEGLGFGSAWDKVRGTQWRGETGGKLENRKEGGLGATNLINNLRKVNVSC